MLSGEPAERGGSEGFNAVCRKRERAPRAVAFRLRCRGPIASCFRLDELTPNCERLLGEIYAPLETKQLALSKTEPRRQDEKSF